MNELEDLETWENATDSRIVLRVRNANSGALEDTIIGGRRRVQLTPGDRRINQEQVATEAQDPFQNGFLAPVRLIEGHEDAAKLSSNPNVISEDEMKALFRGKFETFTARLETITLPITLQRMLRVVEAVPDAQVRQVNAIQDRLTTLVNPPHEVEIVAEEQRPAVGHVVTAR